ncbi:hypothetical protein LRP30_21075 [Bradyrhizobium sp. C-145]|uniref:hypothetical protein n=1 Tax=Bradyrhizobium sp. C-145 TaxID=574727 RepID=UPI00201B5BFA|nr:hypothetical protein [Bradyrhizobium sp. C-145]UQR67593.1 hypothetical protein LRP30_21075 [Bradyrhizobium sp. C-145]
MNNKLNPLRLWYVLLDSRPLSHISWSSIRRIGQSRLLSLTIIVPFLGSVILFNQAVVNLLSISPEVVSRWFHLASDRSDETKVTAHTLTLSRLYFAYFGLSFLGFGSALFALFCPESIKEYPTVTNYQSVEAPLATKPRFRILLRHAAHHFCFWQWNIYDDYFPLTAASRTLRRLGEPVDFLRLFLTVILEVYGEWCRKNGSVPDDHSQYQDDESGLPDPWKLVRPMAFSRRTEEWWVDQVADTSFDSETRNDILALSYMAYDHSKPLWRLLAASFYACGFGLLLIPTFQTFYNVLSSLFARAV